MPGMPKDKTGTNMARPRWRLHAGPPGHDRPLARRSCLGGHAPRASWKHLLVHEDHEGTSRPPCQPREDGCTGSFWQGRFTSVALLGQSAVIACMAYVDLNPIRARVAETPETSRPTSVHDRINARQAYRIVTSIATGTTPAAPSRDATPLAPRPGPEHGLWITPIAACTPTSNQARALIPCSLNLDTYLELVDQTGRIMRSGKRGAIPTHLAPILARFDIDAEAWICIMTQGGHFLGSAIGTMVERAAEAARHGVKWLVDRLRLHRPAATNT